MSLRLVLLDYGLIKPVLGNVSHRQNLPPVRPNIAVREDILKHFDKKKGKHKLNISFKIKFYSSDSFRVSKSDFETH